MSQPEPGNRRVVVTGIGVAAPIGLGIEPFWEALLAGRCGIRRIKSFDPSGLASQVGGELPPFSLGDFIPKAYRKMTKVMARDIVIALVAAYHAVKDAGLNTRCLVERGEAPALNVDSTRFGANIGAGLICADLAELAGALNTAVEDGRFSLTRWGAEGMSNLTPLWLLKFLPNMLACHVTIVHDAQGASNTVTCAEASSHLAIGEAFRTIARGDADVCICGGAESKINPMALARPLLLERINTRCNDQPELACQPFGSDAAGTVVSEGGGLLILESLEHARARGARVYAELVGFGAASNTVSWSRPDPAGTAVAVVVRKALADARTTAEQVDLITTFGTGIPGYDEGESTGLGAVFGSRLPQVAALAIKGALGNNGAGSGALDVAATIVSLFHNTVPPSLNTGAPRPGCNLRFAQRGATDARIREAVTIGYSLSGGQTAALVFRKFQEQPNS